MVAATTAAAAAEASAADLDAQKPPRTFVAASLTATSRHSWLVLGSVPCHRRTRCVSLIRTNDSGRHWSAVVSPNAPLAIDAPVPGAARSIRFANPRDGWIFGGSLWSTHDGGKRWRKITLAQGLIVADVAIANRRIYALAEHCDRRLGICRDGRIVSAPVRSDRFRATKLLPRPRWRKAAFTGFLTAGPSSSLYFVMRLARLGQLQTTIYRYTQETWTRSRAPCQPESLFLAPVGAGLFAICAGQPGAGAQAKTAYTSMDQGHSWRRIANPPARGYVTGAVATSRNVVYIANGRGGIVATRDGGSTWQTTVGPATADGWSDIQFISPSIGLALPWNHNVPLLLATTDAGASWHLHRFRH